jgi:lysozyme
VLHHLIAWATGTPGVALLATHLLRTLLPYRISLTWEKAMETLSPRPARNPRKSPSASQSGGANPLTTSINPACARGIDVSDWQGPHFPWHQYHGEISFAMIKATEGATITDPDFHANWIAARDDAGVAVRLAYHFARPGQSEPEVQAARLTAVARAAGMRSEDHFMLDWEDAGNLSPVAASFWAWTFCTEVNRLNPGHRILVYTFPAFAESGHCAKLASWALIVANWGVLHPEVPCGPWKTWKIWQWAAVGIGNDMYNGDEAELAAYFSHAG